VTAIVHLAAFASRFGAQLAALRPLVADPAFDSAATAAGIREVSGTLTSFDGLETRVAPCAETAALAARVSAVRRDARAAIDSSSAASIRDQVTQRAVAAELFGLLDEVTAIATATDAAADAAGLEAQVALVPDASAEPLGSLPPLPTPTPGPTATPPTGPPGSGPDDAAFFGPDAKVTTYAVTGTTPLEIVVSIRARGPVVDWLPGRAEALTVATPHVRIATQGSGSACRVVIEARPAVVYSFAVTLPRWTPPQGVAAATVTWWNAELRRVAIHERHHVELWRAAGVTMTSAVASSTCDTVSRRLTAIVQRTARQNCEFDVDEYGEAVGLDVEDCLAVTGS
jgi:predicted secreted Zn-dependent protease